MSDFAKNKPILFEIVLVLVSFIAAAVLTGCASAIGLHPDLSSSIARIVVSVALILLFRKGFLKGSPTAGLVYVLPALLFAAWNLFYNLSSGAQLGGASFYAEALVTAAAPALFEEVLFRGAFVSNLKAKGHSDFACLIISAIAFALLHATNAVGQDLTTVALQVGYSLVVGLVFAAIYLKNGSLAQLVLAHFLVDFSNRIYVNAPTYASYTQIALFAVVLLAEALYAFLLTNSNNKNAVQ